MELKPFFTFFGGKWRSAKKYPSPAYDDIIEPFAGSAGYSHRYAHLNVHLNDADPAIVQTWTYLINVSESDILRLPDIAPDQHVDDLIVSQEARILIGWWLNKGAAVPCKSPSAWMRAGTHTNSYWGEAIRQRIASQLRYIRHWKITQGDYQSCNNKTATWFIDPPYIKAGRCYKFSSSGIDYGALGEWCLTRSGQTIVCEADGATWLPFQPLGRIKASPARHGGKESFEAIYLSDNWDPFA